MGGRKATGILSRLLDPHQALIETMRISVISFTE